MPARRSKSPQVRFLCVFPPPPPIFSLLRAPSFSFIPAHENGQKRTIAFVHGIPLPRGRRARGASVNKSPPHCCTTLIVVPHTRLIFSTPTCFCLVWFFFFLLSLAPKISRVLYKYLNAFKVRLVYYYTFARVFFFLQPLSAKSWGGVVCAIGPVRVHKVRATLKWSANTFHERI